MTGYLQNIEDATTANNNFRQVLYTGDHSQLVVMSLKPLEEIGKEVHPHTDQFFRVEEGEGKLIINGEEHTFHEDDAFIVPAGAEHNVINTSQTEALKLYTIYSPPNHPAGTIHATKAEADTAEAEEHH